MRNDTRSRLAMVLLGVGAGMVIGPILIFVVGWPWSLVSMFLLPLALIASGLYLDYIDAEERRTSR